MTCTFASLFIAILYRNVTTNTVSFFYSQLMTFRTTFFFPFSSKFIRPEGKHVVQFLVLIPYENRENKQLNATQREMVPR